MLFSSKIFFLPQSELNVTHSFLSVHVQEKSDALVDAIISGSRVISQMTEIEDVPAKSIENKWLRGMMEECDTRGLVYHPKQETAKSGLPYIFLDIPDLKAIVAASTMAWAELYLNPNEDPWEMQEFQACAQSPRRLAETIIHTRMKQLGK